MNRRISEPISLTATTEEPVAAESPAAPLSFDFTQPLELLDDVAKSVYYRLRRVALMAANGEFQPNHGQGDASMLPDGRTFTEAEVIEILGPDYLNGAVIDKRCCG